MKRLSLFSLALVFPVVAGLSSSEQKPRRQRNRVTVTDDWKLNAGRMVKGQYGREIEATTTGANGFDSITATVEVGGFDPSCIASGSCTTKIIW